MSPIERRVWPILWCMILLVGLASGAAAHPMQAVDVQVLSGASPFPAECAPQDGYRGQEYEPSVVANPVNQNHLVATWTQDYNLGIMTATSFDGGLTWRTQPIPNVTRCTGGPSEWAFDARAALGPDGIAYVAGVRSPCAPDRCVSVQPLQLFFSRSADGGLSWSSEPVVVATAGAIDWASIAADPDVPGAVNVTWSEGGNQATYFSRSVDQGVTWSDPRPIRIASTAGDFGYSELLALENGNIVLVHTDLNTVGGINLSGTSRISASYSEDKGATWAAMRRLLELPVESDIASAAIGSAGTAYIAVRTPTDPGGFGISVLVTRDGGESWSEPVVIPTSQTGAFGPRVAVAGDGTIGVSYLDRRNDVPGDHEETTDVWLAHSHDAGVSWSETHVGGSFDSSGLDFTFDTDWQWLVGVQKGFIPLFRLAVPAEGGRGASDIFAGRVVAGRRTGSS